MQELKGTLKHIQIDYETGKPLATFLVDCEPSSLEKLFGKLLNIKVGKFKKKRSLDSNAYFHLLVDKLSKVMNIPRSEMKNRLIADYGQLMYLDGEMVFFKSNAKPEFIHKEESVHMWLHMVGTDGAYWYRMYRPTHEYNTEEMARLIRGTVEECKAQGIETATPEELERMNQLWKEKYERST